MCLEILPLLVIVSVLIIFCLSCCRAASKAEGYVQEELAFYKKVFKKEVAE